MKLKVKA